MLAKPFLQSSECVQVSSMSCKGKKLAAAHFTANVIKTRLRLPLPRMPSLPSSLTSPPPTVEVRSSQFNFPAFRCSCTISRNVSLLWVSLESRHEVEGWVPVLFILFVKPLFSICIFSLLWQISSSLPFLLQRTLQIPVMYWCCSLNI